MTTDRAPFEDERQAHAAAVAAIPPEPGWSILSQAQCSELLHAALTAAGVDTSAFEDRTAWWMANWEDYICAIIARWIASAHEAGTVAGPAGAVTEWALSYTHRPNVTGMPSRRVIQPYPDEAMAREAVASIDAEAPEDEPKLYCREIGPWKEASDA